MNHRAVIHPLEKILTHNLLTRKQCEIYFHKHKNFSYENFKDWLLLFDYVLDKKNESHKKFQLKSNWLKKIVYGISLFYNQIRYDFYSKKFSWWHKITDNIYLGALPLRKHIKLFKQLNISCVLSLVEDFERKDSFIAHPVRKKLWEKNSIVNRQFPFPDFRPVPLNILYDGASYLNKVINENRNAYVHCKAGRGRSASVVMSYFILFKSFKYNEAFDFIKSKRSHIALENKRYKIEVLGCLYKIFHDQDRHQEQWNKLLGLMS